MAADPMTHVALESLLSPISEDAPAGPDLEYDAEFMALERAAAPKAERAIGGAVKAAEEPDWDKVAASAEALLGRSKDLRVAVHLTTAWMRTDGLSGWTAGLGLVRGLLEQWWGEVHPQLDAEDDNDPTARVNAVVPLGDPLGVLGYFRTTTFAQSPRLGRFSLRDLRIANGSLKVEETPGTPLPSMTEIDACCMDCPEEELAATATALELALEHAKAIDAVFGEQVGTAGPDLKPLLSDVFELRKFVQGQLALRQPQGAEGEAVDGQPAGGEAGPAAGGVQASGGRIQGPQDVTRRLDELCEYYAKFEPSSPIPLLLRRAQRLVGRDFLDILQDLAPGGVSELQVISGKSE